MDSPQPLPEEPLPKRLKTEPDDNQIESWKKLISNVIEGAENETVEELEKTQEFNTNDIEDNETTNLKDSLKRILLRNPNININLDNKLLEKLKLIDGLNKEHLLAIFASLGIDIPEQIYNTALTKIAQKIPLVDTEKLEETFKKDTQLKESLNQLLGYQLHLLSNPVKIIICIVFDIINAIK